MQLRWTEEAANDLERIADYLLLHAPDETMSCLWYAFSTVPSSGRRGRAEKTIRTINAILAREVDGMPVDDASAQARHEWIVVYADEMTQIPDPTSIADIN